MLFAACKVWIEAEKPGFANENINLITLFLENIWLELSNVQLNRFGHIVSLVGHMSPIGGKLCSLLEILILARSSDRAKIIAEGLRLTLIILDIDPTISYFLS